MSTGNDAAPADTPELVFPRGLKLNSQVCDNSEQDQQRQTMVEIAAEIAESTSDPEATSGIFRRERPDSVRAIVCKYCIAIRGMLC